MQLTTAQQTTINRIRTLEPPRSSDIYQLARINGRFSRPQDIPFSSQHANHDSNGQYDFHELHQQAGRHAISTIDVTSYSIMALVSQAWNYDSITTRTGSPQSDCRLRITATVSEESLDDTTSHLQTNSSSFRPKRHGSFCGQTHQPVKKLCLLAPRPGQHIHGCVHDSLDSVQATLSEPSVEPNPTLPPKNYSRESSSSDNDNSLVAECLMVPHSSNSQSSAADVSGSNNYSSAHTEHTMANEQQDVEAIRVAALRSRYKACHVLTCQ